MPTCSINLHDDEAISKLLRNMLQKDLHHFSIGSRQNKGSHFPRLRSNSSKSIESLTNDLMRGTRPHACWCPASSGLGDAAKTGLVLNHKDHWSIIIWLSILARLLNRRCKFFLNASCACRSAFG